jgi:hypothetical protein
MISHPSLLDVEIRALSQEVNDDTSDLKEETKRRERLAVIRPSLYLRHALRLAADPVFEFPRRSLH